MQLLALPVGIVASVAVAYLWFLLAPVGEEDPVSPGMLVLVFFAIIPIHELIHAWVHPRSGLSNSSILGFWPSRLLFYAHYDGELPRNRFIAILLMPLLIISFAPLLICTVTGSSSVPFAFASIFNALCACGDIFGAGLVLVQVPSNATVRNQGWRTFFKIQEAGAD